VGVEKKGGGETRFSGQMKTRIRWWSFELDTKSLISTLSRIVWPFPCFKVCCQSDPDLRGDCSSLVTETEGND
jgi:hypothetical protein